MFQYRDATPKDASASANIILAWGAETPWMCTMDDLEPMTEFWRDLIAQVPAWVAEKDGTVVGFCVREDDNIAGLFLTPSARGFGVGKHLLDLAKRDRNWITVWAYEKNVRARKFYKREGLVEVSRETEHYNDGVSLVDIEHRWIRAGYSDTPWEKS